MTTMTSVDPTAVPLTVGGIAHAADIAQMRHETIGTRVFRS